MMNKRAVEREVLSDLVAQLSELSKLIAEEREDYPVRMPAFSRASLFGFDLNGPAGNYDRSDYERYYAYMEIINEKMREFGLHIGNNGYAYILDAVKIILDMNSYDFRLTTDIYPLIAIKYHIRNFSSIEHSMRNAINSAYNDYRRDPSVNSMGCFLRKPTNKMFLVYIADSVQQSMCESMMRCAG